MPIANGGYHIPYSLLSSEELSGLEVVSQHADQVLYVMRELMLTDLDEPG